MEFYNLSRQNTDILKYDSYVALINLNFGEISSGCAQKIYEGLLRNSLYIGRGIDL